MKYAILPLWDSRGMYVVSNGHGSVRSGLKAEKPNRLYRTKTEPNRTEPFKAKGLESKKESFEYIER